MKNLRADVILNNKHRTLFLQDPEQTAISALMTSVEHFIRSLKYLIRKKGKNISNKYAINMHICKYVYPTLLCTWNTLWNLF